MGLTATGLVKPETLKGLKEYNPGATFLGEVGGIGGSLALGPFTPVGAVGASSVRNMTSVDSLVLGVTVKFGHSGGYGSSERTCNSTTEPTSY